MYTFAKLIIKSNKLDGSIPPWREIQMLIGVYLLPVQLSLQGDR